MVSSQRVLSAILRLSCMDHADFTVVHVNKRLTGYGIATHENTNDIKCTVKCVEHHKCRSYNFNRDEKSCQLNSKAFGDNDTTLTDSPDWYYKSTDYNNTLLGPTCEEFRPCPPDILCRDTCASPFYECVTCDEKHTGLHCDKLIDRDECANKPCKHGTCLDKIASYQCNCNDGYTGKDCETEINECQSLPCFNGATCNNLIGKFNCSCITGYNGTHCENEINECESSPCQNGAACSNLIGRFVCKCLPGYDGVFCENDIDECKGVTYQNGGACNNLIAQFTCTCIPGYVGTYCETDIDECQGVVCQNGAKCQNLVNHFMCNCTPGYVGTYCETDFDECGSQPCRHGGGCNNKLNSYECSCLNGTVGKNCETALGKSCLEIKTKAPGSASGVYAISATNIGKEFLKVFCDMATDEGGWTQVLHVKSRTSDILTFIGQPITMVSASTLVGFSPNGNYAFKTNALSALRNVTNLTQFRFRCQTTSKILHIRTNAAVSTYLSSFSSSAPTSCGSFQRLPDDNSILGTDCAKWKHDTEKWAGGINEKLTDHTMFIVSIAHWNLLETSRRFECDDYRRYPFIHNNDLWEVYVRSR